MNAGFAGDVMRSGVLRMNEIRALIEGKATPPGRQSHMVWRENSDDTMR